MSEAMNIIIAGSRDFDDYRLLKKTVSDISKRIKLITLSKLELSVAVQKVQIGLVNVMRLIMVTPL